MNLIWLDDFLALAASGNFSRAADERHMTQPAFSRRIRALEEWLGADLFDRSIAAGQADRGRRMVSRRRRRTCMARVARVPGEARAVAEASSTTLRFASTHALSFTFLPRWLRGLESRTTLGPDPARSRTCSQRCEALLLQSQVQFVLSHAHAQGVEARSGRRAIRSCAVGSDVLIPVSAPDANGRPRHRLPCDGESRRCRVLSYSAESGLGRILREVRGAALDRCPRRASSRRTWPRCCGPWRSTAAAWRGCRER